MNAGTESAPGRLSRLTTPIRYVVRPFARLAFWSFDLLRSTAPILRRELIGVLRTRQAFWISVATVAAASLVPLLAWPEPGTTSPFFMAQQAFMGYHQAIWVAALLFVPVVAGGAISRERENDTYESLYNTLIRPPGIVLGKLFATVGFFVLLLALSFPVVCVLFLLGGFEIGDLLGQLLGQLVWIAFLGVVGLWSSMRNERTSRAIVNAFLIPIVYLIAAQMVVGLLFWMIAFGGGGPARVMWWYQLLSHCVMALVGLFFFISLLRSARLPTLPSARRREKMGLRLARAGVRPSSSLRRKIAWSSRFFVDRCRQGIPESWNPVFIATLIVGPIRRGLVWRVLIGLVLLGLLGGFFAFWGNRAMIIMSVANHFLLYVLALVAATSAAAVVATERQGERDDLLRSTLLGPGEILRGKLLAVLVGFVGVTAIGVIFNVVLYPFATATGERDSLRMATSQLLTFLPTLVLVVLVSATAGVLAATITKTTVAATTVSAAFCAAFLIGPWFLNEGIGYSASPLVEFSLFLGRESDAGRYIGSLVIATVLAICQFAVATNVFARWRLRDR